MRAALAPLVLLTGCFNVPSGGDCQRAFGDRTASEIQRMKSEGAAPEVQFSVSFTGREQHMLKLQSKLVGLGYKAGIGPTWFATGGGGTRQIARDQIVQEVTKMCAIGENTDTIFQSWYVPKTKHPFDSYGVTYSGRHDSKS